MENKENKNHYCENCKYFCQYYSINNNRLKLMRWQGHCTNENLHYKTKDKIISKNLHCDYWQQLDLNLLLEEQTTAIEYSLKSILKQINDIELILQEQNNLLNKK